MDDNVSVGICHSFESHWIKFEAAFKDAYTDLGESVKAEQDLRSLRMQGGDIDTYIATFDKLLKLAGYHDNEHGALTLFKAGLPGSLNICIINNSASIPVTLAGWKDTACQQQLKYLQV
jgi:hypothetical protein